MADLTQALLDTQNTTDSVRLSAENKLNEFKNHNFSAFLQAISQELANEEKPVEARQLAAIMLKNAIVSIHSSSESILLAKRWLTQDVALRNAIKHILFLVLGTSSKVVRSQAAIVLANIGAIEIPHGQFPELLPALIQHITTPTSSNHLKAASFEALGFVCELIPDALQSKSGDILGAIQTGMAPTAPNDIKLAATIALGNSLNFVKQNMADTTQRNLIMEMIFASTRADDVEIRTAAFECLVTVAATYYEYLGTFMGRLFELTAEAMNRADGDEESVALQATEFWATVAEEEANIKEEEAAASLEQRKSDRECANYIQQALGQLTPILLHNLTKQDQDPESEEWNIAEAAGSCLTYCAQAAGDNLVDVVLPFVTANVQSPDWRLREAATIAFACILEGPSAKKIKPLVASGFKVILFHLKDSEPIVVDTAAWTIGRICALQADSIPADTFPTLMEAFEFGLKQSPKIASHICWAIHNLANNVTATDKTSPLSRYMELLLRNLLTTAERSDGKDLIMPSYEAINVLISTAAADTYPLIGQLCPVLLARLQNTLHTNLSGEAKERQNEVQALLCGCLQVIISKDTITIDSKQADDIMSLLIKVLQSKQSTVLEEAIMAIGALANRLEKQFAKYLPELKPLLLLGLRNEQESKVCECSVGLVGDIARALEDTFPTAEFGDQVMTIFLSHLTSDVIDRMIKPHIISCMGDIALALGVGFVRYLDPVLKMIVGASKIPFVNPNYDTIEFRNSLRTSILEAYTGILYAFKSQDKQDVLRTTEGSVEAMIQLIDLVNDDVKAEPDDIPEELIKAAVGLIGDLGESFGQVGIGALLKRASVKNLINVGVTSQDESTKQLAQNSMEIVTALLTGGG